ncbi:hypothetical protein B296_00057037 [Ensete ventricosum]|uniref:Uncharacterized protein n=1 Tax=Ensete ventricosum TaxID=4639 RepID=A0A426XSU9_ENSVE|nr:hypothetical protein B296_00057037 [Ensete ventricosum]
MSMCRTRPTKQCKASILGDTARVLSYLFAHVESLSMKNAALLSESHYENKHSTTNPRYPTSSDWTSHQASKVERYVAAAALALAARRKDVIKRQPGGISL